MSDTNFITFAVAGLKAVADKDPGTASEISAALAAAGFSLPASLAPSAQSFKGIAVGEFDPACGVYLGTVGAGDSVVHAYVADDFLRDAKGNQLILTFNQAVKELAVRNNGRSYGNGTDRAIKQAIASGAYIAGDLALPSKELLHGRDVQGNTMRSGQNIFDLMKSGKLPKIAEAVANGSGDQRWAVSGSEHPDNTLYVRRVRLADGYSFWFTKDLAASAVVPVRYYRTPSKPTGKAALAARLEAAKRRCRPTTGA